MYLLILYVDNTFIDSFYTIVDYCNISVININLNFYFQKNINILINIKINIAIKDFSDECL